MDLKRYCKYIFGSISVIQIIGVALVQQYMILAQRYLLSVYIKIINSCELVQ